MLLSFVFPPEKDHFAQYYTIILNFCKELGSIAMYMNTNIPTGILLTVGIVNVVLAIVYYIVSTRTLTKKTNVK